jgi:hypothetical protein
VVEDRRHAAARGHRVAGNAELAQHGIGVEVGALADQAVLLENEEGAEAHLERPAGGR